MDWESTRGEERGAELTPGRGYLSIGWFLIYSKFKAVVEDFRE